MSLCADLKDSETFIYLITVMLIFPLLISWIGSGSGKNFIMGCECGIRNVDEKTEEDCKESQKLEAAPKEGLCDHKPEIVIFIYKCLKASEKIFFYYIT